MKHRSAMFFSSEWHEVKTVSKYTVVLQGNNWHKHYYCTFFRAFICAKCSLTTMKNNKINLNNICTQHTTYHSSGSTMQHYTAWSILFKKFQSPHQIVSYSASRTYRTICFSPHLWCAPVFETCSFVYQTCLGRVLFCSLSFTTFNYRILQYFLKNFKKIMNK